MPDRIPNGTAVTVTVDASKISGDWDTEAQRIRKGPGIYQGIVIKHHDSHGLCYVVRFPDGTESPYDPHEVEPL